MTDNERVTFGEYIVDAHHNTLTRGDETSHLQARVMDVLVHLIQNRNRVVSQQELLETYWTGRVVEESTLHRVINQLRKALDDSARDPRYIRTISKRGYQAIAPIVPDEAAETVAADTIAGVPIRPEAISPGNGQAPPVEVTGSAEPGLRDLQSIAVLPFVNMSDDRDAASFADGLMDAVLDELSRSDLSVASRTDSFNVADTADIQVIAERLNVAYVLEGSVQRQGDALRLTTQLIRAKDRYHVWSKIYDRQLADPFATQMSVAANLAQLIRTRLWSDIRRQHSTQFHEFRGVNKRAVRLYLDAEEQYNLLQLGEGGDWDFHIDLIRSAAVTDPTFALAHFDLAWAYMQRLGGELDIETARREAHAAIEKAIALDPNSPLGHLQLAQIYLYLDLDYASAEQILREGIERLPKGIWWHVSLAEIAFREGRTADGRRLMGTAAVMDYGSEQTLFLRWQSSMLVTLGDYRQALDASRTGLQLAERGLTRAQLLKLQAYAYIGLGDPQAARQNIAEAWQIDGSLDPESYIYFYAATGDVARARALLDRARENPATFAALAEGALALQDEAGVFKWLEAGIREHNATVLTTLRVGRQWDDLRDDRRFGALIDALRSRETPTTAGANRQG